MSLQTQGRRKAAKHIAKLQAKRKVCENCGKKGLKVVKVANGYSFFCKHCRNTQDDMDKTVETETEQRKREEVEAQIKAEKKEAKKKKGLLKKYLGF